MIDLGNWPHAYFLCQLVQSVNVPTPKDSPPFGVLAAREITDDIFLHRSLTLKVFCLFLRIPEEIVRSLEIVGPEKTIYRLEDVAECQLCGHAWL